MRLAVLVMWLYLFVRFSVPILELMGYSAALLEHERFYLAVVGLGFFSDRIPAFLFAQAKKIKFTSFQALIESIKKLFVK